MQLIITCLTAAALCAASPGVFAETGHSVVSMAMQVQAQVESPTIDPAGTTPAAWANLIWIAVGLVFLILLVGAVLLGVRSTGDRPPSWRRRRTRE